MNPSKGLKAYAILALMIVGALLAACGGEAATAPPGASGSGTTRTFVGKIAGSDAFVGLATDGQELTAFVCDGTPDHEAQQWGWFKGTVQNGAFDITNDAGARLTVTIAGDTANGSVKFSGGQDLSFSAAAATGQAALLRGETTTDGKRYIAGWIVQSDGQVRGGAIQDGTSNRTIRITNVRANANGLGGTVFPISSTGTVLTNSPINIIAVLIGRS